MRISNLFFALFLAVVLVGCTTSEANNEEKIMAELKEQMELAEREVAEAIEQMRDEKGDASEIVKRKIEDARREMERAQRKLEELYAENEKSEREYDNNNDNEYYTSDSDGNNERIRIRINKEGREHRESAEHREHAEAREHGSHHDGDHDSDQDYDSDNDYNFDEDFGFDIDIDIDEEAIERISERIEIAINSLGEAFENRHDVNTVDVDDLSDLFPQTVAGMKRVNINSSSDGAFGFRVTHTKARYEGQRTELTLAVVDLGALGGVARTGIDMLDAEIDHKSNDEYERTTKISGHPAKISFEKGRRHDSLDVVIMIADRFVFAMEAEGTDLSEQLLEDVLDDFPIEDIEDLK